MRAHEFRRGGAKHLEFGPPGGPLYVEDCRYEDIVAERRICFVMTILSDGVALTSSLVTVEFLASGRRTEVVVTDQIAILDGSDSAADRERGWGETLDKLPRVLARQ